MSFNFQVKKYDENVSESPVTISDRSGRQICILKASQYNDEMIGILDAVYEAGKKKGTSETQRDIRLRLGLQS